MKALPLMVPVLGVIALFFIHSSTPVYLEQRLVLSLLYNFCLANITLNLMLTNMTKKHFSLL